jgi:uncharacterized protein (TIGR02099 family)
LLTIALATLKYVVMPRIGDYQADILSRVSQASGMEVSAKSLKGGWSGFSPFIEMEEVVFREPANTKSPTRTAGAVALTLPLVRAGVSIPYLFIGQPRITDLAIFSPSLSLIRASDGLIYFAGRALNQKTAEPDDGRFLDWLIEQPGIQLNRAKLTWRDDMTIGSDLNFTDVGIQINKRFGKHEIGFTATPPVLLAKKIGVRGRLTLGAAAQKDGRLQIAGSLYAEADSANLGELRRHLDVPDNWQAGVGTVRAWVDLESGEATKVASAAVANPVKSVTADVHIVNARAQLGADAAPLNIAKLAGRLDYKRLDDGFSIGSQKLEFRTKEGVVGQPADFSFALRNAGVAEKENGEITANGIDLKVVTSLIEYFPIGREVRQTVAKFGMRGEVRQARFQWVGKLEKPARYEIKGALVDFASLANEKIPGVTGFSGNIDGNDKGGVFAINAKALSLDAPNSFRAPLRFDAFSGRGKWTASASDVTVNIDNIAFANDDLKAEFAGKYQRKRAPAGGVLDKEDIPGALDISGKFSNIRATKVGDYLPNGLAATREFLDRAARDGVVETADFSIKGRIFEFPFHLGKGGQFSAKAKLKDVDFRFADTWPIINNINGELIFENTAIRGNVNNAQIFNARIRNTNLSIDDTVIKPYSLNIKGEADARGEDVMRYFRESPLIDGSGAFTKSVAIEGAGKLNLDMSIPIGVLPETVNPPKFRIKGNYALTRGSAKPVVGPLISNLSGGVQFSEAGIVSNQLLGTAYGNPLSINIASSTDGAVATDFAGRADVQQLGILPFQLPQQITGVTDFAGRILAKAGAVDITLDSSMLGVTSALPFPLAKRADEARRLKVAFNNVGQPTEKIRVNLLGNIAAGSSTDIAETRIDARFQNKFDAGVAKFYGGIASVGVAATDAPIPEGIWLVGAMKQLDFDQWLKAITNFTPKTPDGALNNAANNNVKNDGGITGIDFTLGKLIAYGRPFDDLKIKGRRNAETWAMSVVSKEAEGDFTWRAAAFNERGAVRARLKKLVLADEPVTAAPTTNVAITELKQNEGDLPALDIVADEFTFKDRWLGKLELKATPLVDNWRIDQLAISNGHFNVVMDGIWQRFGDPFAPPRAGNVKSLTSMNVKLESSNLNALFNQFGFGDHMKGGRGGLEGKLSWPGHTYQFQLANLAGSMKINAERGQFAKIEAGAGKLLGLISLQSIPRRLTFDFRDLFSEGFAFDTIDGDVTIADGVIFAKKFDIAGPAAVVKMTGDISLPTERQNLTVIVAPKLSGIAAVGTAVLVNPLAGLAVLLGGEALKSPIEKVLSVQYSVTGTWEKPDIERTGKTVAPPDPVTPPAPKSAAESDKKKPA